MHAPRFNVRRTAVLATTGLAGLVLLAACGGGSATPSTSAAPSASSAAVAAGPHNAADVAFATDMIPHHAQAIEMADMAAKKAADAEVKSLAAAIAGAQGPEIATMTSWLQSWGQPVPAAGMAHMGHGGGAMPGMMSSDEMAMLDRAAGADFDRMWVQMMTRHHQGAVQMARTELTQGQNPQAKQLARSIISSQTREIATMATIAKRLS